jgi:hypothetical protein
VDSVRAPGASWTSTVTGSLAEHAEHQQEGTMNAKLAIMTGLVFLSMVGISHAQATTPQTTKAVGTSGYDTVRMTGEVVQVDGNWLVAKMQPTGTYALFNVQPGREFLIDGQKKLIGDLKPGTMLTAMIITRTTPVTARTTATLNGTVWWVQGNFVILTLANGEHKEYKVPESYRFMVDGKQAAVQDLRPGMKITATKIVEEQTTEISSETVITGTAPK